jgi:hypothetical protein
MIGEIGEKEIALRVFDRCHLGALHRLHRELRGWHGFARELPLDEHRVALVVRPAGALDPAANTNTLEVRKGEAAS